MTKHLHNDEEEDLTPYPISSPEAKPPGSDPPLSIADSAQGIKGTLAYLALAQDGEGTGSYSVLVLRSLGGSRLLPSEHPESSGGNVRSDIAVYGFHEGEYGSGNPQFSPDGQVLLYEQIMPMSRYGSCSLFECDMKAARVRQLASRNIAYLNFFWSPDSQSIAYVSGGERTRETAQLNILDRRTLETQTVALPEGVSLLLSNPSRQQSAFTPISWASPTSVLLTGVLQRGADKQAPVRANIYEAQTADGKARLLIPQAFAPRPSPDGRWIACFGWPQAGADELKLQPPQAGLNIYLVDRVTGKRFFVRALPKYGRRQADSGSPPPFQVLHWTPNSRRLILTEETYQVKGKVGEATATLSTLDVPSSPLPQNGQWAQALRLVMTLHLADVTPLSTIHFGPLQVSSDNNHLFMSTSRVIGQQGEQPTREFLAGSTFPPDKWTFWHASMPTSGQLKFRLLTERDGAGGVLRARDGRKWRGEPAIPRSRAVARL